MVIQTSNERLLEVVGEINIREEGESRPPRSQTSCLKVIQHLVREGGPSVEVAVEVATCIRQSLTFLH